MDADDIEEACRDVRSDQPFGPARANEVEARLEIVVGREVLEDIPAFGAPAHELRDRCRGAKSRRIASEHLHEAVRVWKRQRTQERRIDHGEDRRGGAYGQGERQDDRSGISGSLAKNPKRTCAYRARDRRGGERGGSWCNAYGLMRLPQRRDGAGQRCLRR